MDYPSGLEKSQNLSPPLGKQGNSVLMKPGALENPEKASKFKNSVTRGSKTCEVGVAIEDLRKAPESSTSAAQREASDGLESSLSQPCAENHGPGPGAQSSYIHCRAQCLTGHKVEASPADHRPGKGTVKLKHRSVFH